MEVDLIKESSLSWNDPARLNGRFYRYDDPECPPDIQVETFFDTEFNESWLQEPVCSIDTPYLDALLATQNITIGNFMQRPADIFERLAQPRARLADEVEERLALIQQQLGPLISLDKGKADWAYDMSFVYAMMLFLCGRCLRPL
jgi:hypothetical protein